MKKTVSKFKNHRIVIFLMLTCMAVSLLSAGCQAQEQSGKSSEAAVQIQDGKTSEAAVRNQDKKTSETAVPDLTKLDEIRERGVLKVGTAGDYQPMSYLDPETGSYVGFDAELAEDLADTLGVEIEYVETSWPSLMADTLAGKFDLAICGITVTDARKEQALMSDGYLGNGKTVLCRAEDADKYTSLEAINRPDVRVMENP